jgi:hypothetical protein
MTRIIIALLFAGLTAYAAYETYFGAGAVSGDAENSIRRASAGNPLFVRPK